MAVYYNEFDPFAAAWLRELIKVGAIADGIVDERSIVDVQPADLAGFTQCHFFAGIGVWSYALRNAGWSDAQPVWTGSCPCQPFSNAGKGKGTADKRHLWPELRRLIAECKPPIVFGEQVASKAGRSWLDSVQTDLEALDFAVGSADLCAAGVGSPNIRQRLYWVGHSVHARLEGYAGHVPCTTGREGSAGPVTASSTAGGLDDTERTDERGESGGSRERAATGSLRRDAGTNCSVSPSGLVNTCSLGRGARGNGNHAGHDRAQLDANGEDGRPGPTNGMWRDADWLFCRDGKWRAVEPGTFPLAHGLTDRVGRLRGYGNAVNAQQAQAFIEAFIEVISEILNQRSIK